MSRWSRLQLALSILTAAGLWQTLRERFGYARSASDGISGGASADSARAASLPTQYDLAGALHVHSTYSDGMGTISEIADAAAKAGVDFVLVSDHSSLEAIENGEQGWHEGGKVLVMIGTEITTKTGHLLVLGVPMDYNVVAGREALDVQEEAVKSGGYGYIALPLDLKGHWRDFSKRGDGFGLEVFNLSSIARTKISIPGLLLTMQRYFGSRPISAFSYVAGRPTREIELWDRLMAEAHRTGRPLPTIIGSLDSHAVMKIGRKKYPFPTYEETFRVLRTHALMQEKLSRTPEGAERDLALINAALRSGRSYVSYDNYGDPRGFSFQVRTEKEALAGMGERYLIPTEKPDPRLNRALIEVRSPSRRSIIKLFRDGRVIAKIRGARLSCDLRKPGVYRAEISNYRWRIGGLCFGAHPWIFSNPIEVRKD